MLGGLTASRAELEDKKAESNRGVVRGAALSIRPRKLGWPSRDFCRGWRGERRSSRTTTSWGIWYTARVLGVFQGKEGRHLYIKGPNPN